MHNTKAAEVSSSSFWPTWKIDSVKSFSTLSESISSRKWEWKWVNIKMRLIEPKILISKISENKKLSTLNTQLFLAIIISKEILVKLSSACTRKINRWLSSANIINTLSEAFIKLRKNFLLTQELDFNPLILRTSATVQSVKK